LTNNLIEKGEAPMKVKVSIPEVVEMFKEIQTQPEKIFEMIRVNIRETMGFENVDTGSVSKTPTSIRAF